MENETIDCPDCGKDSIIFDKPGCGDPECCSQLEMAACPDCGYFTVPYRN